MTKLRIGLVACAKTKLDHRAPARDLYVSPLFKAARAFAERNYHEWWILSAKHGLVDPDTELDPYDLALHDMDWLARTRWGVDVLNDMQPKLSRIVDFRPALYLHAGKLYRDSIPFEVGGWNDVYVPLEGLQVGQQLHWYKVNETLPQPALL